MGGGGKISSVVKSRKEIKLNYEFLRILLCIQVVK